MNIFFAYFKKPTRSGGFLRTNPLLSNENFRITHTFVKTVLAKSLEEAFWQMQGEVWSPNGEARELIRSKDLDHTSMSVGDLLMEAESCRIYEVERFGFREIPVTLHAPVGPQSPDEAKALGVTIDKLLDQADS